MFISNILYYKISKKVFFLETCFHLFCNTRSSTLRPLEPIYRNVSNWCTDFQNKSTDIYGLLKFILRKQVCNTGIQSSFGSKVQRKDDDQGTWMKLK